MFLLKPDSELQNLFKKFPVQYENINKLQTAFPRSGMHRGLFSEGEGEGLIFGGGGAYTWGKNWINKCMGSYTG